MNEAPLTIGDAPRDLLIQHYRSVIDRLTLQRAEHAGLLSGREHRLMTYAQLVARVALTEAQEMAR